MSIVVTLDRFLSKVPDGYVATEIALTEGAMLDLLSEPTDRVTLTGDDVPINRAYERDYPDRLVWFDVLAASGKLTRAWHVSLEVILHQRDLKRERGISLYRGIPITVVPDEQSIEVRWEPIVSVLARRSA